MAKHNRFLLSLIPALFALANSSAFAAKLTLTFDDGPRGDTFLTGMERTQRLLSALKKNGVEEAAIYCNLREDAKDRMQRLQMYADAGLALANHTASHLSFGSVATQDFTADIKKADDVLQHFATYKKWFRFPYRRESGGAEQLEVKTFLLGLGYRIGYSTVENMDWVINDDLQLALVSAAKKSKDMTVILADPEVMRLKKRYIQVTLDSVKFYDQMGMAVLGRSPVHVLLMHEMDINGLFLDDLIIALKAAGNQIVPASDAFLDPIADTKWDAISGSTLRLQTIVYARQEELQKNPKDHPELHYEGEMYSEWMSYYNGGGH